MKKFIFIICIGLSLNGCALWCTLSPAEMKAHNDEFSSAFGMVNKKIWGDLMIENKNDLTTLQYEGYLKQLKTYESVSSKKVEKELQKIDEHLFIAIKDSFIICVKSKKFQYALCDDGYTANVDQDKRVKPLPGLEELSKKIEIE